MSNLKLAEGWIRTADLWCPEQLLYQLSHNPFPSLENLSQRYLLGKFLLSKPD